MKAVPVPKAQMMGKQDWRFVSGGAQLMLRKAHIADTDITSLVFSRDNLTLLSRAADDTLKVHIHNNPRFAVHFVSFLALDMIDSGQH